MSELQNARFEVMDDASAEWCLKRIREAEEELTMWKEHYQEQLRKMEAQTNQVVDTMTALLEEYFDKVPHHVTNTQESYALPHAKLVRKHQQPEYSIDQDVAVPYMEQNGMSAFVKTKKMVNWADLKRIVNITEDGAVYNATDGEIIAGITAAHRPDVFRVEMEG